MSMTAPPLAFLQAAHAHASEAAQAAMQPAQFLYPTHPVEFILAGKDVDTPETRAAEAHIRLHMPDAVLRRIEAEREILARCGNAVDGAHDDEARALAGAVIEDLARAWGWAAEQPPVDGRG